MGRLEWVVVRVVVLLGALLLFLVEPMAARLLLPVYGGSAAVWMTCLVFFQTALLVGYGYARWAGTRPARLRLHASLVLPAAVLFAGAWAAGWMPAGAAAHPVRSILWSLTAAIGVPFCVLAATSPLVQVWVATLRRGGVEYRLFGWSNVGSVVGLAAYPAIVEGHSTLAAQRIGWAAGVVVFAGLSGWLGWKVSVAGGEVSVFPRIPIGPGRIGHGKAVARARWLGWFALAAVGALQLGAVTEYLTSNVAAIPLLWMLPLGVYLLTFVLAFEARVRVPRGVLGGLMAVMLVAVGNFVSKPEMSLPIGLGIGLFLVELGVACLFCHAELYRLRPEGAEEATAFYLAIAAGGAAGSFLVGIAAPLVFRANYDLSITFVLTAAVALGVFWTQGVRQRLVWVVVTAVLVGCGVSLRQAYDRDTLMSTRNFYGSLRVRHSVTPAGEPMRTLLHGTITHGTEVFPAGAVAGTSPLATTYYAPRSGVGLALELCCEGRVRHVGVVGLGAGTLGAYARAGDRFRFYEINPAVRPIAEHLFTYLRAPGVRFSYAEGDGRALLAGEPAQGFDVLVVDAFSGDAIPLHLLTVQAMAVYARHLAPGGVLAFHISNQYVDLEPELAALAHAAGMQAVGVASAGDASTGAYAASWVLMTRDGGFLALPEVAGASHALAMRRGVPAWTDDRSSLLPLVRW